MPPFREGGGAAARMTAVSRADPPSEDAGHTHDHSGQAHQHEDGGAGAGRERRHRHSHAHPAAGDDALAILARSTAVLAAVAAIELGVAVSSGSAAVLADGLHNLGDVSTTVALAIAFVLSRRAPTRRFPYGYHRTEDVAGVVVLLLVLASAVASAVTSIEHLVHRGPLQHPALALGSALIGFVGNEGVARYKTVSGRRLRSVSLQADGQHSRVDGLASLGAAAGVVASWAGASVLDPVAGLLISVVIGMVAWDTARTVTPRLIDEADASLLSLIEDVAAGTPGVVEVGAVRARWTGRQVRAELVLAVDPDETVSQAHALGEEVRHRLFHQVEALGEVVVHLDPAGEAAAHSAAAHHQR